ncbi:MAG: DUF2330 domain-containing protein [Deltaproteobacteria bacterium]|nr:DUF2330 domain-containing protein [Deltaproteobacteria bacterium]
MKAVLARLMVIASALLPTRPVAACGGGFGHGIEINPSRTIVVAFGQGVETYVFNPSFCGTAAQFGLILPVPAPLVAPPTLKDRTLYANLEAYTAPEVVTECRSSAGGCGAADSKGASLGAGGDAVQDWDRGVNVVDAGQVGVFDWVLLQADTAQAFTDWLDANAFPYAASSVNDFSAYVDQAWYFVAFKVTAGTDAPAPGAKLCGDLGPLSLQFPTPTAVVPARIAAANLDPSYANIWRVVTVNDPGLTPDAGTTYSALYFSGVPSATDLDTYEALGAIAAPGARVSTYDVHFPYGRPQGDIWLLQDTAPRDFRSTTTVYEDCGCAAASANGLPVFVGLAVFLVTLRWPRRRRA